MAEKNTPDATSNLGESAPSIPVKKDESDIKDNRQTKSTSHAVTNLQRDQPDVFVNVKSDDVKQANKANLISLLAIAVNFFLLFATYRIWSETKRSVDVASNALSLTRDNVKSSDSINAIFIQQAVRSADALAKSNAAAKENYMLAKEALTAQIRAFNDSKKQFEKANTPFLEIAHAYLDTIAVGKPLRIKFRFENYGNYTVKVVEFHSGFIICESPVTQDNLEYDLQDSVQYFNRYISKEKPLEAEVGDTLSENNYQWLVSHDLNKLTVYYFGYLKYKNLSNSNARIYKFRLEFDCKSGAFGDFKVNENVDSPFANIKHLGLF